MGQLFDIINIPLSWILKNIASLMNGSFAGAVFVFTLLINLALIPLNIKSQKSSVQQTRIKPKLDDLKKRYGDDKRKYSEAMQKVYADEGVSLSGGCLPMILRLVLMMSIYTLILSPLTYMADVDKANINNVSTVVNEGLDELKKTDEAKYTEFTNKYNWKKGNTANELSIVNVIRSDKDVIKDIISEKNYKKIEKDLKVIKDKDKENHINYTFISKKIDLTQTPKFSFNFKQFKPIWLMPILAFLAQILSSILTMSMQKKINPDAPQMAGMMLTMPLISLFIGFGLPGGVAFYWACSSLIGGLIQVGVQNFYGPHKMLSRQRAKELVKQCDFEAGQIKKIPNE